MTRIGSTVPGRTLTTPPITLVCEKCDERLVLVQDGDTMLSELTTSFRERHIGHDIVVTFS